MEDAIHTWIIIVQVVMCIIVHIYSCPKPSMASICVTYAMLFLISYNKSSKPVHPCMFSRTLRTLPSLWAAKIFEELVRKLLEINYDLDICLFEELVRTEKLPCIISRALEKLQPQVFLSSSSIMSQLSTREWGNIQSLLDGYVMNESSCDIVFLIQNVTY